jgi:hypothetical protein
MLNIVGLFHILTLPFEEFWLTTYKIIKEFKCAVTLIEGRLHLCRLKRDGTFLSRGESPNWELVMSPVGIDFITAANKALGTSFTEASFKRDKIPVSLIREATSQKKGVK